MLYSQLSPAQKLMVAQLFDFENPAIYLYDVGQDGRIQGARKMKKYKVSGLLDEQGNEIPGSITVYATGSATAKLEAAIVAGGYWTGDTDAEKIDDDPPTQEEKPKERIVHGNLETVVVTHYSYGWESDMPVTLIRYRDGSADLHCQTGDHHDRAIADALDALADRYITIDQESDRVYSTGVYYKVTGGLLP